MFYHKTERKRHSEEDLWFSNTLLRPQILLVKLVNVIMYQSDALCLKLRVFKSV